MPTHDQDKLNPNQRNKGQNQQQGKNQQGQNKYNPKQSQGGKL